MGNLLDSETIDNFIKDVDEILKDKDACFYLLDEKTAQALCVYLEGNPVTNCLMGIDWQKEPTFPITRSAVKYIYECIHTKSCL